MEQDRERLDALEVRTAYQDQVIEDLSASVSAQWAAIDALDRRLAQLADRLAEAEQSAGQGTPAQKPPHY